MNEHSNEFIKLFKSLGKALGEGMKAVKTDSPISVKWFWKNQKFQLCCQVSKGEQVASMPNDLEDPPPPLVFNKYLSTIPVLSSFSLAVFIIWIEISPFNDPPTSNDNLCVDLCRTITLHTCIIFSWVTSIQI